MALDAQIAELRAGFAGVGKEISRMTVPDRGREDSLTRLIQSQLHCVGVYVDKDWLLNVLVGGNPSPMRNAMASHGATALDESFVLTVLNGMNEMVTACTGV